MMPFKHAPHNTPLEGDNNSIVIMILLNNKRVSLSGELHILCLIIQYFEHFLQQPFSASLPPKLSPYILHPPYYRAITIDSI